MTNTNKILKNTIAGLVFLAPLAIFIVSTNLFFPYITGKAFYLRTIILIATALYLILIMRDKSYLPKRTVLVWATSIFMIILALATAFAIDPVKSFWSNQERMEGFVMLIHFYLLFIVAGSVLDSKNYWRWLLNTMLVLSVFLGLDALRDLANPEIKAQLSGGRIIGQLGNSSYLGGYAMVHAFLAFYLASGFIKRKGWRNIINFSDWGPYAVILYALVTLFNVYVMFKTGTRGSFVGIVAGLTLTSLLWIIFERKNKKLRIAGATLFVLVIIGVAILGVNKESNWIKKNDLLYRFSSLITFDFKKVMSEQGYSRTLLWGMSWQGVKERPLLGWGQDNFGYVFAKYYDPKMYAQEQWFDRTHNVLFDWLISAGFLGLLSYLSLFVFALYIVWRKRGETAEGWSVTEKSVLTGLLAGYFLHNLFVFDNLSSYTFFFIFLAYVNYHSVSQTESRAVSEHDSSASHKHSKDKHKALVEDGTYQALISGAVAIVFIWIIYSSIYLPYQSSGNLIKAMQNQMQTGSGINKKVVQVTPAIKLELFKKALADKNFTNTEAREQLFSTTAGLVPKIYASDQKVANEFLTFSKSEADKQFKLTPKDPRPYYFLAFLTQNIGDLKSSLSFYSKVVSMSPNKQSFLNMFAMSLGASGDTKKAVEVSKKSYELEKNNTSALVVYFSSLVLDKQVDEAVKIVNSQTLINPSLIYQDGQSLEALMKVNRYDVIYKTIKEAIAKDPNNIQARVSLAAAYLKAGERNMAIVTLQEAEKIAPQYAATFDGYIKQIREGKDPSQQ